MANTQTTVPTFVPGQVLEAAQLVNSAATGVPVFATTVTRDAGFGGAGEKTLAQGQLCYLESTNVVQYYDGAAWATLAPAPAVSSGLTLISQGTKSAATTQSFNSVFSTDYRNYKVILSQITSSTDNQEIYLRVGTSGTPFTGNNYKFNRVQVSGGGAVSGSGATTNTNMTIVPNSGVANNFVEMTFNSPFESERTIINAQTLGNRASFIPEIFFQLLVIDTATSYTDISVTTSSGANFTCNYAIYGFAK